MPVIVSSLKPMKLKPPIKDYIWGGTKLRDEFGKESDTERLAESWELSCHPDGQSVIDGGEFDGWTLENFLKIHPEAISKECSEYKDFPVLIKLIDAKDNLSVQVHPDNDYARKFEGDNGKTEMWYVVDCEEDSELIYGFKEKISKEEFCRAIEENKLIEYVNIVKVKKGDVFFIEPGTLHAIGRGIVIAEIQQNSNVTYRVYDYGRTDDNGKPRELHIEKAIDVTRLEPPSQEKKYVPVYSEKMTAFQQVLCKCRYFTVTKFEVDNDELNVYEFSLLSSLDKTSFCHILVIDGAGEFICHEKSYPLKKGASWFIPANWQKINIKGKCSIIITVANK